MNLLVFCVDPHELPAETWWFFPYINGVVEQIGLVGSTSMGQANRVNCSEPPQKDGFGSSFDGFRVGLKTGTGWRNLQFHILTDESYLQKVENKIFSRNIEFSFYIDEVKFMSRTHDKGSQVHDKASATT